MEQLPVDIEEKLEKLPIIPFDGSQEFQDVIFSNDFTDVFKYYSENYMPDVVKSKSELYQRVSLYLTLTNQDDTFTEQTNDVLYKRPCPDIHTFLNDKFYMGYSNATLYPFWKDKLEDIFKEGSPIRKVIFGGSLGIGKSTVARKAFLYVLYRILCLRYPRASFNIDQDSTIANVVIATTLKQVYEVNLLPFVKLMESMPCFQRVMSTRAFENFNLEDPHCPIPFTLSKSDGTIYFPDNIILTSGSNAQHFTGLNCVNSFCDEINDYGTIENTMALLNTLDNRFASRFQGSDLVFQSIVSSARTSNSAMGEYIRHLPKDDPSILNMAPKLYEVKPDPEFRGDGSVFWVLVGNGSIPSKIITDPGELKAIEDGTFVEPMGCTLIDVPTPYRSKFELQLDQSIQDIAGMTTSDNNSVFRDTTRLEEQFLTPEMYFDVNIREDVDILGLLEPYNLFEKTINERWQFKRAPMANRYIHVDLSAGGSEGQCDTGLCVVHKEWLLNENTKQKDVIYVVDLLLFINAKIKVDIHAIQTFLTNLVAERNIPVNTVSFDQYNSLMIIEQLEASGYFPHVEKVSVDAKLEPYTNASSLIEKGQVKIGRAPKLKKELEALIIDKGKVTRTVEYKDGADALVGAIWDAQLNYVDFPVYEFKDPIQENRTDFDNYEDLIDSSSEILLELK